MIDPVAATLGALAHADPAGLPLAFAAGAVTSIGPCVAPRYVAVAALVGGTQRRGRSVALFVAGLLVGYTALGFGIGLVESLLAHAAAVYFALSAGLLAFGCAQLLAPPHAAQHRHPLRTSGVFTLGASSALIVSPCCTPVVAAVAALGASGGRPMTSALFLLAFALGHALPLLGLGATGSFVVTRFAGGAGGSIAATVSGTLLIGLGVYYGLLA